MHIRTGNRHAALIMERIDSARLFIRGLQYEEWHSFWRGFVPDAVAHPEAYSYDEKDCEKMFENAVTRAKKNPCFGIFLRETEAPIGIISLKNICPCNRHAPKKHQCEMGITMQNAAHQNKGYGTEAMQLFLPWAFAKYELKRMYAETFCANFRMQRLLSRWGFCFVRKNRAIDSTENESFDTLRYVLVQKWYNIGLKDISLFARPYRTRKRGDAR